MEKQIRRYLPYVHTTQGTASTMRYSNGNTLPLTQLPWGMAAFCPQTQMQGHWFYHPADKCLEGIRLTHQPSPWIGDFGCLTMMPQIGTPVVSREQRWSGYRSQDAQLSPDYMRLRFLRSRTTVELVPTERGAMLRLRPDDDNTFFSVFTDGQGVLEAEFSGNRILGWTNTYTRDGVATPEGFRMYFVLDFEDGFRKSQSFVDSQSIHAALYPGISNIRFAISFISIQQAIENLRESAGKDFEALRADAIARWEELLGKITFDTQDTDLRDTFYSCLYRCFLYPTKSYEIDASGNPIHYDAKNNCVKSGYCYTNNGFWDTYRTVYPLYSLIAPESYKEILSGFLETYHDTGWLPKWPSLVETGCMPGTMIDAVLADAAVKGLLSKEEMETALSAMRKHAEQTASFPYGRPGILEYLEYGYVPRNVERESVNTTLDYAYGDFCIAQVAKILGCEDIAETYMSRAQNYRNLFDRESGFMRGKDSGGACRSVFDPYAWGGEYTEGSAWQNSFAVYHDLEGLAQLHGGREQLQAKLDALFSSEPIYDVGGYGMEIHEMAEMAARDFGQCAISNQPSFHLPWMYAALGYPEKTAFWIRKIASEAFSWRQDGLPGDDDNGSMSAWFLFAVLGFYPICPGTDRYVTSAPLVSNICINGKPMPERWDGWISQGQLLSGRDNNKVSRKGSV